MQTVVQLEGENKLVTTLKGVKSVTEFNGDTAISVSGHSDSCLGPGVNLCYHLLSIHCAQEAFTHYLESSHQH